MKKTNVENLKTNSDPIIKWTTKGKETQPRDYKWYIVLFSIALILGVIFYYQKIYSAVALVIVFFLYILTVINLEHRKINCAIYNEGVVVGKKAHLFNEFKEFGVVESAVPKFYLLKPGFMSQYTDLIANEDNAQEVYNFLHSKLPEGKKRSEDLVETINRIIRI